MLVAEKTVEGLTGTNPMAEYAVGDKLILVDRWTILHAETLRDLMSSLRPLVVEVQNVAGGDLGFTYVAARIGPNPDQYLVSRRSGSKAWFREGNVASIWDLADVSTMIDPEFVPGLVREWNEVSEVKLSICRKFSREGKFGLPYSHLMRGGVSYQCRGCRLCASGVESKDLSTQYDFNLKWAKFARCRMTDPVPTTYYKALRGLGNEKGLEIAMDLLEYNPDGVGRAYSHAINRFRQR